MNAKNILRGKLSKLNLSDNKNNVNKEEGGFTIVEVMIVLAIAGLVLAMVFIAVPALQRNARNTQRRADLGGLRAQIDTWTSNNGSKLPETQAHILSITGSTGWGHYNGNDDEPGVTLFTNATTLVAVVASTTAGETRPAGKATGAIGTASEYVIYYAKDLDPIATMSLPSRQEIHIWGEMECGTTVLVGGNDSDKDGIVKYDPLDIVPSNARAIAFVYQIEGEDNARCEDNA